MRESTRGVVAMALTCTVWGLSPLYYKLLSHIPPLEILAHRTLWSFVFFAAVLLAQGRFSQVGAALGSVRAAAIIGFAALMISTNWFVFILSIQIGHALEASLGYYLFPLVAVVIGMLAFGETLSGTQRLAVALAAAAVILLTYGLGVAPWVALILSVSFGLYGFVKKWLSVGPVVSVTAEVLMLAPIAIAILFWRGDQNVFATNWRDSALLAFSGLLTATPLILFSYATKRVRMVTIGLVQYLNPTLQFFCAVLVFGEPFGQWHAIAFTLIWIALALYSVATLRQDRAARRASVRSADVATEVT